MGKLSNQKTPCKSTHSGSSSTRNLDFMGILTGDCYKHILDILHILRHELGTIITRFFSLAICGGFPAMVPLVSAFFFGVFSRVTSHFFGPIFLEFPWVNRRDFPKTELDLLYVDGDIFQAIFAGNQPIIRWPNMSESPYKVGPPSDVCWFINPINYIYKYHKS